MASICTIPHYIEKFKYHTSQKLTKTDVFHVFDIYQEKSIKGDTTSSRGGTGMIHQRTTATILATQIVVLTVTERKKRLT